MQRQGNWRVCSDCNGLFFGGMLAALLVGGLVGLAAANPMAQSENFMDRPGGDYFSYRASGGAGECSTSCATDARCRAYTFVISNSMCFKKDRVPDALASNCCISGVKLMGAKELSIDRPGSDIRPGFDSWSPDSCETDCRNEPACLAYTWVKAGMQGPTAKCWLKNTRPAKVSRTCCVSGVRLPPPRRVPAVTPRPPFAGSKQ